MAFVPGWNPAYARRARARMVADGVPYATVRPDAPPPPPAFSLTDHRPRHLEQGRAGTCWTHAAVQLAEVSLAANGFEAFPICRRLVAWAGKQLEDKGNPSDGGSPSDALATLAAGRGGYGAAHETLLPYTDNYLSLAARPPAAVFDDAKPFRLDQLVDVRTDDDARRMIAGKHAVAVAIWWPFGWDDGVTFHDTIGPGEFGHALTEVGYAMPGVFDKYAWFQLDNWHGLLYPPLPPELAAKVPGYRPVQADRTSDFWVRADIYERVRGFGYFERIAATGAHGWHLIDASPDSSRWSWSDFA